jgi:hypothetical protein
VRKYLRALEHCSTAGEVLTLVQDTAATIFPETSYVATTIRQPNGKWSCAGPARATFWGMRTFGRNYAMLCELSGRYPSFGDALVRFPNASSPGDILTIDNYDTALLARKLKQAHGVVECLHESLLTTVIRSRSGFVAHLFLSDFQRVYSTETERVCAATLADFASLALSNVTGAYALGAALSKGQTVAR